MSVGLKFSVKEQGPGNEGIQKIAARIDEIIAIVKARAPINQTIALFVKREVKDHLIAYNSTHPNQIGGARTNWYSKAANMTNSEFSAQRALVGISQVGIRLQIMGGTVLPGANPSSKTGNPTKSLAIPASPIAHGKTPAEFSNLMFVPCKKNIHLIGFLQEVVQGAAQIKGKKITKKGRLPILPFNSEGGIGPGLFGVRRIIFWLVKFATIKPHPDVIPSREKLLDAAYTGVNALFTNLKNKQQPPTS